MIPPGECMYAGRKRRKPVQKQRPPAGAERTNPSKRHRDRLNAELDHLASLLPFPPDVISKLDKLSVLRLSVSYFRVKSFFQAMREKSPQPPAAGAPSPGDSPYGRPPVLEGRLLLESLDGFALVVSAEGMIFYASATIVDYLGFHQTDVLHQNIYDYIHVDDRHDFRRQLHWAMDPPHAALGRPLRSEAAEDAALGRLLRAQEDGAGSPAEYSAFLTRCFVCRVRCLLDSTSGFLTMQFQGKLKFLFGQKRKAPSGTALPPRLSLFCTAAPALLPSAAEMKVKSTFLRLKHGADISALTDARAKAQSQCEPESHVKPNHSAGRNSAENGLSVFRAQTDGDRWAQLPARATCPCLKGGPDSVLDPRVASGGGTGEGRGRAPGGSSTVRRRREGHAYDRHLEAAGPAQQLHRMTGALGQEGGTRLKLEPSTGGPLPGQAGAQGIVHTDSFTASGSSLVSHPSNRLPSAYTGRPGRTLRDGGQAHGLSPASFPLPQRSLENGLPPPRGQRLAVGGYCTQDTKFGGGPVPPGSLFSPTLSLDVPIKMESDSGSDDAADNYSVSPSQVWLGATDVAKRQLVTFPTRMHLKTELGHRHQLCAPHLGHSMLGANPRPGCNLALFHPARCACLEHVHCVPEPEPPPNFCAQGHQPPTLGRNCRAPGTLPVVKREPLDSPPWATHSQDGVPGTFPKSALATLMLPKAPEGTFLL